ncbi:MAG: deoxyribonucleoside 5'-monophosphate N-glycosidase [Anaerolineae bacterium]|jgi:nucleoside 2-deoxyribosyltransferase|nr:deoxyribonucleoside 5'-monophosphate N-glycosidase [Anaerolineae bacterium]MBT3712211.1 deoxyribonucleoside 5'-monophosphate N-glycosidase [Anaerolineae bacterium]MBT4310060.1 deoxyribonucleoside 5'-monophosphate N-glycosidase [Anaerolineae bacterium]MBT4457599.1 deoxyribonucleoside 5'-monophosphate N-glycosidase [Anaerolineae bacterium]MBT4841094.1 deoxyribonucleoside 5'-monophosphate N-glycosidase [Anaerolineae bacterium]
MKIYFACSITGGREYEKNYQAITRFLLDGGYEVPTAHLAESNVLDLERVVVPSDVYARDVDWILTSDILLAEVSVPSHGVGYEIGFALNAGKHVLCIHQAGRAVSKMITGNPHPLLTINAYEDISQALEQIKTFVNIVTSKG